MIIPPVSGPHALERQFLETIRPLIPENAKLVLAVSGGSDSIGMMHLFARTLGVTGDRLSVGIVNHNLRAGVEAEIATVRAQAAELDLPVHLLEIPKAEALRAKHSGSLQSWARTLRYQLLARLADELGASHIATGHTVDDQAETVMLRILRGAGLDGIGGIPTRRRLTDTVYLLRPLLAMHRSEIRDYLRGLEISWAEDPSNRDPRYLRVRIRNELLPLMNSLQRGASDKLAAIANDARDALGLIYESVPNLDIPLKPLKLASGFFLDSDDLARVPGNALSHVVRRAIRTARGDLARIERSHIDLICEAVEQRKNTDVLPLPGTTSIYADRGSLYLFPKPLPPKVAPIQPLVREKSGIYTVDFPTARTRLTVTTPNLELAQRLVVRTRLPGDKLWNSRHKLKRILNARRIPKPYRNIIPLLALDTEIVSSPLFEESRHPDVKTEWNWESDSPLNDIGIRLDRG